MRRKIFYLILLGCFLAGCGGGGNRGGVNQDYRQKMRHFVQAISSYARDYHGNFIVIPQNGGELLSLSGDATGTAAATYIAGISGVAREDLFYGYDGDNIPTSAADRDYLLGFTELAKNQGLTVLVVDYCSGVINMDDSYSQNATRGYISFAADQRELNNIPSYPTNPYAANANNITTLAAAQNFLYLINPENYATKEALIGAIQATNFDLIIIDLFVNEVELTSAEVAALKTKANGGTRLVVCYLSIGEAEDFRYYWQAGWETNPPDWLGAENPEWPGNYRVRYWDSQWQAIIYGNDSSYLKKIIVAGFDGVYLDLVDAFEYYE